MVATFSRVIVRSLRVLVRQIQCVPPAQTRVLTHPISTLFISIVEHCWVEVCLHILVCLAFMENMTYMVFTSMFMFSIMVKCMSSVFCYHVTTTQRSYFIMYRLKVRLCSKTLICNLSCFCRCRRQTFAHIPGVLFGISQCVLFVALFYVFVDMF